MIEIIPEFFFLSFCGAFIKSLIVYAYMTKAMSEKKNKPNMQVFFATFSKLEQIFCKQGHNVQEIKS